MLFGLQVDDLLSGVDPCFIEKFVARSDLLFLHSFLVTPNSHRLIEIMHASSNDNRLLFVRIFTSYLILVNSHKQMTPLSLSLCSTWLA